MSRKLGAIQFTRIGNGKTAGFKPFGRDASQFTAREDEVQNVSSYVGFITYWKLALLSLRIIPGSLVFCLIIFVTCLPSVGSANEDCVVLSLSESKDLLKESLYTSGLFEKKSCEEASLEQSLHNIKVEFKSQVIGDIPLDISKFTSVTLSSNCQSVRAAYHIWVYFLFEKSKNSFDPELGALDKYLVTFGVGCPEEFSGFVSSKVFHGLTFPDKYSAKDLDHLTGEQAIKAWRRLIRLGRKQPKLDLSLLEMLRAQTLSEVDPQISAESLNILVLLEGSKICQGVEEGERTNILPIPFLVELQSLAEKSEEEFENLCNSVDLTDEVFSYHSEW